MVRMCPLQAWPFGKQVSPTHLAEPRADQFGFSTPPLLVWRRFRFSQLFPHCIILSDTAEDVRESHVSSQQMGKLRHMPWDIQSGPADIHVSISLHARLPATLSCYLCCAVTPLPPVCADIQETALLQLAVPSASLSL